MGSCHAGLTDQELRGHLIHMEHEPTVTELFDLSGRTAIVTGACGHLGSAMANALAEAGARVIVTSRDVRRAAEFAASLVDQSSVGHRGVELDQMNEKSIATCMHEVIQIAGQIDILVNNAHEATSRDWRDVSADEFNHQLANATAYFLLARHLRDHAVNRRQAASVVMIGSMYGSVASYPDVYEEMGPASPASYHALKGSILQLTRHLAAYWALDNVRVNCLSPGPFPSSNAPNELVQRITCKSPMHRIGRPHELKGALLLLASDAGSYITGQNLVVDGGWTAW